ncbi:hypothetical protein ASNO1_31600 [Corallococcus caeni]|uniref:Lipoprotein n=2 Tax=Corallococcus caeni TaxID=3082388 RepID=A0ABQ6QST1_9BACT|nr:hypothetical protein ASNO1_31600 [Corallococcus sp. NO1]
MLLASLLMQTGLLGTPLCNRRPDPSPVESQGQEAPPDSGISASTSEPVIPWPKQDLPPLATLEGPAIQAAHAALEEALKRFPKESTDKCAFSARALEVVIGQEAGWYFARVNRRVDRCPGFGPGVTGLETDWFELYAISPKGEVTRYPYQP